MNLTYKIDQVLCPKMQSKHGVRYHVLGTRQLLNRDRYKVLSGMLISNRYSFVKQISVWNQTEKNKLQGTTFTLFFLYKSQEVFETLITPLNPPWLKSVLTHYSRGVVWPTVIQAQLGPHIVTLCLGTASQQWLMGGGVSLGISF